MAAVLQGQTRPRGLSAVRGRRRAGQVEESQLSSRVIAEVREQVRRRGLDPFDAPTEVASIVDAVLNEHDQISARTGSASFEDLEEVRHRILDAVAGFGVLQPLLDDDSIEGIWINGSSRVERAMVILWKSWAAIRGRDRQGGSPSGLHPFHGGLELGEGQLVQ